MKPEQKRLIREMNLWSKHASIVVLLHFISFIWTIVTGDLRALGMLCILSVALIYSLHTMDKAFKEYKRLRDE